ncbi:hypothetical protein KQJ25_37860, partial [Escherichia sp. S69_ASV_4]|nr:hypothetical protein [Escherichia sp. S69_ASV_4]
SRRQRQMCIRDRFRTEQQYENATRDIAVLEDAGVPYQLLESSRLAEVEPALAEVAHKLTGGLQLPNDETGDCQLFTQNLARMAEPVSYTHLTLPTRV